VIPDIDIKFEGIIGVCINVIIMVLTVWVVVAFFRYFTGC